MRIASLLLPLFIFSFGPSLAQKKTEGFIVTHSNDTIACIFGSKKWKKHPSEIQVSINLVTSTFTPRDIKLFQTGSSFYETHSISLARYNTEVQNAIRGREPLVDTPRTVFLKVLHRGRLTLYEYVNTLGENHYFISNKIKMSEIYVNLYSDIGGYPVDTKNPHARQPIVVLYSQFVYTLKTYMQDCPELFNKIDHSEFKPNVIIQILKEYDKCSN